MKASITQSQLILTAGSADCPSCPVLTPDAEGMAQLLALVDEFSLSPTELLLEQHGEEDARRRLRHHNRERKDSDELSWWEWLIVVACIIVAMCCFCAKRGAEGQPAEEQPEGGENKVNPAPDEDEGAVQEVEDSMGL